MKYANTIVQDGVEIVATVLPLSVVPGFDPANPPQANTYGVPDDVQVGWVKNASGNFEAPPPVEIPPPVISVTPWQIRKALNATGLRDAIEEAVAAGGQTVRDAWSYAQEFRRDNPLVSSVAYALGKTDAEIDAIFDLAKTL